MSYLWIARKSTLEVKSGGMIFSRCTLLTATDGNMRCLARKFLKLNTVIDAISWHLTVKIIHTLCSAPEEEMLDLLDLLTSFYFLFMGTNLRAQLEEPFGILKRPGLNLICHFFQNAPCRPIRAHCPLDCHKLPLGTTAHEDCAFPERSHQVGRGTSVRGPSDDSLRM